MSVRIGLTRALNRIMSTKWKHNFSAGPSAVDAGVLAKLSAELASFEDTGMVSVDVA
jgi:phosphoserine aminotransferase